MKKWLLTGTVALATLLAPQSFAKKSKDYGKSSEKKKKNKKNKKKKTAAVSTPVHFA